MLMPSTPPRWQGSDSCYYSSRAGEKYKTRYYDSTAGKRLRESRPAGAVNSKKEVKRRSARFGFDLILFCFLEFERRRRYEPPISVKAFQTSKQTHCMFAVYARVSSRQNCLALQRRPSGRALVVPSPSPWALAKGTKVMPKAQETMMAWRSPSWAVMLMPP